MDIAAVVVLCEVLDSPGVIGSFSTVLSIILTLKTKTLPILMFSTPLAKQVKIPRYPELPFCSFYLTDYCGESNNL